MSFVIPGRKGNKSRRSTLTTCGGVAHFERPLTKLGKGSSGGDWWSSGGAWQGRLRRWLVRRWRSLAWAASTVVGAVMAELSRGDTDEGRKLLCVESGCGIWRVWCGLRQVMDSACQGRRLSASRHDNSSKSAMCASRL